MAKRVKKLLIIFFVILSAISICLCCGCNTKEDPPQDTDTDQDFDNIETPETIEMIESNKNIPVCLLPGKDHPFNLIPEYDGVHTFTIDGIGTYKVELESLTTGKKIPLTGTKNVFTGDLNAGETYQIRISKDGITSYDTALFRFELTGEQLKPDNRQPFEISADKAKNYCIENASANNYVIEFDAPERVNLRIWRNEKEGNLIHTTSDRVNLLVEGGSHYYVSVMNESGGKVSGTITLRQGNSLLLNSELKLSFGSGEKMYFKFNPKFDGAYLFDTGKASCSLKIYDETLNEVNKNSLKASETYFVCIENTKSSEQTIAVTAQFNPPSISFGENNCSSEYVMFQPKATESYLFSVSEGTVTIYDLNFTPLHIGINNKSVLLEEGGIYYIQVSKAPVTIEIGLDSAAVAQLDEPIKKMTDEYGNAYFVIEVKAKGTYSFASNGTIYLYDSHLNLQEIEKETLTQGLFTGTYIIKVKGAKNEACALTASFTPGMMEVGASLNVTTTGENYYRFIPKYTETYKFYTRGDNNNSFTTQIVLYDSDLNEIARSASGKYVDLTANLTAEEVYYVKVVLENAVNQSVVFSVIYMSGEHDDEPAQMEIFNGGGSKQFDMQTEKAVSIKFVADKSVQYNFYLEKEENDKYTVKLFNGTNYITTLSPTELWNGRVSKFSFSLTKGIEYYFIIIGTEVDNLDTVFCSIVENYDDLVLTGYSDGDIANRVEADGVFYPCKEYQLALVNGNTVINFDDILVISGEEHIYFDGDSFIIKGNALGRNIVFAIEYYYETYILSVEVGNPCSSGQ